MQAQAQPALPRRAVITGVAGLTAVGLCAAAGCGAGGSGAGGSGAGGSGAGGSGGGGSGGGGSGAGGSGAGGSGAAPSTAAPPVPVTGPSGADVAPSGSPAGVGSAGTRLGGVADVPVGGGTVYESLEVVVTQPQAGRYEGLSAVCTHTGCIVDKVANGLIECPCHGSRYHLDGSVARGPAPRALTRRPVTVVDGAITLV